METQKRKEMEVRKEEIKRKDDEFFEGLAGKESKMEIMEEWINYIALVLFLPILVHPSYGGPEIFTILRDGRRKRGQILG